MFKKLSALLSMDEEQIPNYFDVQNLEFDTWNDVGGLEVRPFLSPHPVETSAFFFRAFWESRYLTYAHLADIVSFRVLDGMVTDDDSAPGMSQADVDLTRENYLIPVDLKKVDIGGGMIHGDVEDFIEDKSDKIVLAHRSEPLTNKQKEIGSSAPFGIVDSLIPDSSGNIRRFTFDFLRNYFPDMDRHNIRTLLNNPIVEFMPGTIILHKGQVPDEIFLVVTGTVEKIRSEDDVYNIISAGGLIGEYNGIHGIPSASAYRTVNYVRALRITAPAYTELIKKAGLSELIDRRAVIREILEQTWLFGETVSPPVQNEISDAMVLHEYNAGADLDDLPTGALFIVESGLITQARGGVEIGAIEPRGFFAEEQVLFDRPGEFSYRTEQPCRIYEVPASVIKNVPIVM